MAETGKTRQGQRKGEQRKCRKGENILQSGGLQKTTKTRGWGE
ncbi:MAG: hypothetical protein ACLT0Y_02215 [Christensenellales bacterium]